MKSEQMTRQAMIKALVATAAAMVGRPVEAQEKEQPNSGVGQWATADLVMANPIQTIRPTLQLDLSNFGGFRILRDKETIEISPEEIWEALGGQK